MDNNQTLRTIFERKSVRKYTGIKPSKENLELLIKAGMAAPSARNKQPWSFIAVIDDAKLIDMAEKLPYAKMLPQAGAAIVVCGVPKKSFADLSDYWVQDCSAATQNILIAAEALELGAVWTGVYPREDRISTVKTVLNLPDDIIPLNVIAIGLPEGAESPKDKFSEDNIHWNEW